MPSSLPSRVRSSCAWHWRQRTRPPWPCSLKYAIQALAGAGYDLALLHLQLPGIDGLQLARTMQAHPILAGVRLVLVTPSGQRGEGEAARAAGIQGYLTKPVRQAQLYDCLLAVLGLREM